LDSGDFASPTNGGSSVRDNSGSLLAKRLSVKRLLGVELCHLGRFLDLRDGRQVRRSHMKRREKKRKKGKEGEEWLRVCVGKAVRLGD
jgi:hypothetical protein